MPLVACLVACTFSLAPARLFAGDGAGVSSPPSRPCGGAPSPGWRGREGWSLSPCLLVLSLYPGCPWLQPTSAPTGAGWSTRRVQPAPQPRFRRGWGVVENRMNWGIPPTPTPPPGRCERGRGPQQDATARTSWLPSAEWHGGCSGNHLTLEVPPNPSGSPQPRELWEPDILRLKANVSAAGAATHPR